jgi:hypothetical protein
VWCEILVKIRRLESEILLVGKEIDRILIAFAVIKKMGFPEWKMGFVICEAEGRGKSGERFLVAKGALSG